MQKTMHEIFINNKVDETDFRYFNTGWGPEMQVIDINHPDYACLVEADTAYWALVKKEEANRLLTDVSFLESYKKNSSQFREEMQNLRFNLKPSCVYFNPTELCNLNCKYCYIPEAMRKNGHNMSGVDMLLAVSKIKAYFDNTLPRGKVPQLIFHGSEPLINKESVFKVIEKYASDFQFGLQTNALLLDDEAIGFLKQYNVAIGISLDGHLASIADLTRQNWAGEGTFRQAVNVLERLNGYDRFSVICTLTKENIAYATDIVEFFHANFVQTCLLNMLRCTQPYSRSLKPDENEAARHFINALTRSFELFRETGRKIVIANFANILLSIMAPSARRLMCDISPCGGGRCFFALSANGDIFPCSEFIGLNDFNGGNIFTTGIDEILESEPVRQVTSRQIENIEPCYKCAIRHFCGAPCPAEAFAIQGGRDKPGAFCRFYEEQVRYAFRLIADDIADDFLYDKWDDGLQNVFSFHI